MTWPVPSSLLRDASHTTGWKDGPWRGSGPFPKLSGEEEDDDEEGANRFCREGRKRSSY